LKTLVERLQPAARHHIGAVEIDVIHLHPLEERQFLIRQYRTIIPDSIETLSEFQLGGQVCAVPEAGQAMKNDAVGVHYKDLKVVWASSVGSIDSITGWLVRAGITGIRLSDDIAIAANVSVSER